MPSKKCRRCGDIKSTLLFHKNKGTRDGISLYCKECIKRGGKGKSTFMKEKICPVCNVLLQPSEFSRDKRQLDGLRKVCKNCERDFAYKSQYGIGLKEYNEMFEKCGGKCQICGYHPTKNHLYIVHCHKTGKVRGLLCNTCNTGISLLKEKKDNFLNAISYLNL